MAPETLVSNLVLLSPELALVGLLAILFLVDGFRPSSREGVLPLVLVWIGCAFAAWQTFVVGTATTHFFGTMVTNDGLTIFFRFLFLFACAVGTYIAWGSKELEVKSRMEYAILLVCVTIGMSLMAIANHLLILYIGIETVSIVSFVLAGFSREDLKSNEASFKYLVFGALSSGLMIYGFSVLYGYTGALNYREIFQYMAAHQGSYPGIVIASLLFFYAGLAYKISAFPFHFWTPDVYEGSPTPVATFFSVAPKAAGFAAILRVLLDIFSIRTGGSWKPLAGLAWGETLAVLSALTMFIGNLSALAQTDVKRMLAYSSIAHVGYMLMGLLTGDSTGLSAILFYIVSYYLMNLGAFWIVGLVHDQKGSSDLRAFSGLGWSNPLLGTCMAIFLFSLTGIPMFSGFIGKFLLFGALIKSQAFLWLAVLGVLNSVISLYYYAKILKAVWLEQPHRVEAMGVPLYHAIGVVLLAIPTILLGLFFAPVIRFAESSLAAFL